MSKFLEVEMPDGSAWRVPAEVVAENRARYYAEKHPEDGGYEVEFEYAMKYLGSLKDWARNNMNWSDVASSATKVERPSPTVDYQEGWVNGQMRVVEE